MHGDPFDRRVRGRRVTCAPCPTKSTWWMGPASEPVRVDVRGVGQRGGTIGFQRECPAERIPRDSRSAGGILVAATCFWGGGG